MLAGAEPEDQGHGMDNKGEGKKGEGNKGKGSGNTAKSAGACVCVCLCVCLGSVLISFLGMLVEAMANRPRPTRWSPVSPLAHEVLLQFLLSFIHSQIFSPSRKRQVQNEAGHAENGSRNGCT